MKISWTKAACEDYFYCQKQDKNKLKRINELIKNTLPKPNWKC
jgi:Txe/YoeB family toxin of Txe-Axe toxin-antitoxin module